VKLYDALSKVQKNMWIHYYLHDLQSRHISDIHNPFSVVLITLYGSIQGSSPEFYFVKIPVNTIIKDSKFIVLSWCECDIVITS
jgi:hypothetical protein